MEALWQVEGGKVQNDCSELKKVYIQVSWKS